MRRKLTVPTRTRTYYRLYFSLIDIYKQKKVWNGGEHKNKDILEEIGKSVGGHTKYYITKIVEKPV